MRGTFGIVMVAALAACGGQAQQGQPAAAAGGLVSGDQVAAGQSLYASKCASCHGAAGEGNGKAPPVVGIAKGALPLEPRPGSKRTAQFKTVVDVGAFAKASMPPSSPGSLTEDEYWAILAFDLKANGIDLGGKKLDAGLASTLVIPR
jgi:cytochrome c